ncbi:MAG: serine/threonine-protein kinase [Polyangiaceae bacterium]
MGLAPGTVLPGGYVVEDPIGAGGIATVYAAKDAEGKPVAIKQLKAEFSHDEDAVKRFVREAYTANAIAHPGAVATLGHHEGEQPFIVMELLDGDTLETRRAAAPGGRLTPAEVVQVTLLVLDVLEVAHKKGIVHRDLKPENIFRTKAGKIKVIDFGLARVLEQNANEATMSGMLLGTASFMAPEQAQGMSQNVDARTDIWSLGATMFMLLTGHYVHDASNLAELLYRAARTEARSVRTVLPSIPEGIAWVVDRALKYDPSQRFQDSASMASALRRAANDRSSAAFEPTMIANPNAPASARPRVLPPPSSRSPSIAPKSAPLPGPLSGDATSKGGFDDLDAPTMVQTREGHEGFNFVADDEREDSAVTRVLATSDNAMSLGSGEGGLLPRPVLRPSSPEHKAVAPPRRSSGTNLPAQPGGRVSPPNPPPQRPAAGTPAVPTSPPGSGSAPTPPPAPITAPLSPDDSSSTAVLPMTANPPQPAGAGTSPMAPLPVIAIGSAHQGTMSGHAFQLSEPPPPAEAPASPRWVSTLLWFTVAGLALVILGLLYLIFFR